MKQSHKLISFLVYVLVFVLLLSGCKTKSTPTPAFLTEELISANNLTNLTPLSGDKLESYFGFKNSDIKRFSVMISTLNEACDTIAVFEATSKEKKALVVSGISGYAVSLSLSMKSVENEYKKLSSRLIMELDNLIILIICADPAPIEQQLLNMGAKAVY